MKNFLLSVFVFITTLFYSQCTYSVQLRDTYGDGWNGGYIQVYLNGVMTYGNYTLSSGYGPVTYNFNVFQGQSISVRYYGGGWSYENYYRVYNGPNATGALIMATNAYSTPPVWTYPSNSCSSALQTQPPSSISSNTNSICQGQSTTLTANNSIGTTYWFTNGCGTTGQFATGSSVNVTPNSTTTYYARNYANGLWSSTCASTTITVTNGPQAPTVNGNTNICLGNSTTLTASGGTNYTWYSAANGTGVLGSGANYTTPSLNSSTTYYVGIQSQPVSQTVVYNINSTTQLFNMNSNCGTGSYYNGCSGQAGFNWASSIPAGATIVSVQIQLSVGVECQAGTRTTTLNGVNGPTFNTIYHCSCSGSVNPIFTLNMNPANYIANGTNQFRITNPPSCFGLFNGNGALSGLFAKVTVVYQSGSACSSSLAAVPITVSNTTQFNQQAMPIMQIPSESIISHPSGQYSHWYNGFQNDQYIATSSVQGDYLTVRMGQPQGALVAQGIHPVSFTGPTTGSYYIHVNTNSNCGTDNQLRTITVNRVSALPIELLYFSGKPIDKSNLIYWATATEHNTTHFVVEKSENGITWSELGTVAAAGNSTQELHYDVTDNAVKPIYNYYRLTQYDTDGAYETFDPIVLNNKTSIRIVARRTNLLGQDIDENDTGIILELYENGELIKIIK